MSLKTAPFDAAEVLDNEEAIKEFVAAVIETEDPAFISRALVAVARACNMAKPLVPMRSGSLSNSAICALR